MNWYTRFIDNCSKAKCNLCGFITDVPAEHYGPTNEGGERLDGDKNSQYYFGSFEFQLDNMKE